jgi:hypothetical protein
MTDFIPATVAATLLVIALAYVVKIDPVFSIIIGAFVWVILIYITSLHNGDKS